MATSPGLHQALTKSPPRPLPHRAEELLRELDAPPRLAAHLRAVHDTALDLVSWLAEHHPEVAVDTEAVLFGAATHDIGKCLHPGELSGPGSRHEPDGHRLLLSMGVPERLARFARTHASWDDPGTTLEDHLVSLADKVWKAKRTPDLEQLIVDRLAGEAPPWQVFMELDDLLTAIADGADARLAFQNAYPVTTGTL
ncbi:HD domain-containing protein [Acrocarpospora phusangensis]|uniref:HD domain-containing protein n=1 Tax=Acrocarpospora phusangensis TaxID=1070424 RepID=UPI00194DE1E5|nr:HD domain-containing protein [Acrocarpospora phusangensis]